MKKLLLLLFIFIPMHFLGQERLGTWKIEDVKVPPLQQRSTNPLKITPYTVKMKAGTVIERMGIGSDCKFHQVFTISGGRDEANGVVKDYIKEELKKYNFLTTDLNVDLVLSPIVTDSRINSCYKDNSLTEALGEAYVQVKWVLRSQKNGIIVFDTTTAGYYSNSMYVKTNTKEANLFTMAVLVSVRRLMTNEDFRLISSLLQKENVHEEEVEEIKV